MPRPRTRRHSDHGRPGEHSKFAAVLLQPVCADADPRPAVFPTTTATLNSAKSLGTIIHQTADYWATHDLTRSLRSASETRSPRPGQAARVRLARTRPVFLNNRGGSTIGGLSQADRCRPDTGPVSGRSPPMGRGRSIAGPGTRKPNRNTRLHTLTTSMLRSQILEPHREKRALPAPI